MAVVLALVASTAATTVPAQADTAPTASPSSFTVSGAGYGHGRGMSQYGAYGAAKRGLSYKQILSFYYPGTKRVKLSASASVKVWISADNDNDLRVMPARGLAVSDTDGHRYALPTGKRYTAWRVSRAGAGYALSYRTAAAGWVKQKTPLKATTWWFSDTARIITVWVPGGARRELRGKVALVKRGSGGRTVNKLAMDAYLRGVVPSEMPTSWHREAVRAQSVAARSYAARLQASARSGTGYDLCDTTRCQVYRGYSSTSHGRRRIFETKGGNAAVKATARIVLRYGKKVVLTEFASSNGGSTVKTGFPYQVAQLDRYDSLITSNNWTKKVTASAIARNWPSAGAIKRLKVSDRTGTGRWGGRVVTLKIIGAKRTVTVTGSAFASRFGMRSSLFNVKAAGSA